MLQTLIASDSKTVTNATHVRGQVGSRPLIVPTHTNHLSTTCLPHVRLETRLPVGTKFREGWSLGTRLDFDSLQLIMDVVMWLLVNISICLLFIHAKMLKYFLELIANNVILCRSQYCDRHVVHWGIRNCNCFFHCCES